MDQGTPTTNEDAPDAASGFADLGLRAEILETLNDLGYEEPTPIQQEAIPVMLAGRDMIGQAATGTGKTAAFALPALDAIGSPQPGRPEVLVLVPTRELAVQVSEAMFKYGRKLGAQVVPVFGGQPIGRQWAALERGAHVVVATPGRALDHIGRGSLDLENVRIVVLDEADEMLDMGFADDIESILESTPEDRQTVLFSATMPPRITSIAKKYQTDPARVQPHHTAGASAQGTIHQKVYVVQRNHKPSALGRILDIETPGSTLVFCRTRIEVDQLTDTMNGRGYRAEALHGGMDQDQRDRVMARLREGRAELLVATDVAARGLDVDTLTHVVNYDVPSSAESYVHRIGRVGRAGREGTAITLAEPRQKRLLANIERHTKQSFAVEKVPTVADLRERQIELTVEAVRESLAADDLDDFQQVFNLLVGDDSERNIAVAAIRLVHVARGATVDEPEIPDVSLGSDRRDRGKERSRGAERRDGSGGRRDERAGGRPASDPETGFLYVNLGRKAGVRPGDLVGAIANESGLSGRQIGPIRIADNHSVVGIPENEVERVIDTLRDATMRGKPVRVRRYAD
jgi:ATP-dependent RNA helicase DeaD